jgi:acetyl esterase/lipase
MAITTRPVVLERASQELADATADPPYFWEGSPVDARKVVDDLQAAPIDKLPVDVLRDEGEAYAARLRAVGVPVTTVCYDGITHDFMMLNPLSNTQATRAAVAQAISVLRTALAS